MSYRTTSGTVGKIGNDLIRLRKKLGGLEAKKIANGPMYAVKSAKDLMIKVRDAGDELGMLMCGSVVHQEVREMPTDKGTKVSITSTVRFMSSDGTYVDFVGTGGGMAPDDKAAGKAHTYSWKVAIVTGLSLPDKEMVDTDDDEILPYVYEIVGKINRSTTMDQLKALKPEIIALKDHEQTYIMPIYMTQSGFLKSLANAAAKDSK